ncbi:LamG-like jellyroll fold domain-containing protein [Sunxiuqinia sp. sy24]|uniref:LamG-like jellyroll fold domain-containing protein n=1 Tax=Sunxiuqinia sp. sy24 TaxID=3461495 RepID=UPI0040464052
MKRLHNILVGLLVIFAVACNEGIDPISKVDPGTDASAPVITINSPAEGYQMKVPEATAPVTIDFEATDDIELVTVVVKINGVEIASYSNLKDYRRLVVGDLIFDNVTNGAHVLEIVATDLEGKTTTSSVNFEKVSPYNRMYNGEVFYMPFDGDFMELISFQTADKVGTPGFADEAVLGGKAYKNATDSYITFPMDELKSDEFSAAFWYYLDPNQPKAGVLSVGAEPENRMQGFRLFRELDDATQKQRFKLNVGTGTGESWNDGGLLDPAAGEWVHIAVTISQTKNTIYFNGAEIMSADMAGVIDWTGCEAITIGAGGKTFSYWDHLSDYSMMDEMRFFDKALTSSEIQQIIFNDIPYEPKYNGEVFYMPFEGSTKDLVSDMEATVVGVPDFANGAKGQAYAGAEDAYLTFPADELKADEFSAVFWYFLDPTQEKAGVLSIGAEAENRQQGFRLFRELDNDSQQQRFKLNVGIGDGESWNDGGLVDASAGEWVNIAITISQTKNTIYLDGTEVRSSDMAAGIDWTGCDAITIGAGGETFSYWGHLSDLSLVDELRMFNKALTQAEIQAIIDTEN